MSQSAIESFSVTRNGADPRADGGTRTIQINAKQIVIERVLRNVRMKVAVPVAAYRGLVISVRLQAATATLHLRHADQDLDVALAAGDAIEVAQKAKAWGALFGQAITIEEACVTMLQPFARQRRRAKPSRRSSFAKRRKIGIAERLAVSFSSEHEIIAPT